MRLGTDWLWPDRRVGVAYDLSDGQPVAVFAVPWTASTTDWRGARAALTGAGNDATVHVTDSTGEPFTEPVIAGPVWTVIASRRGYVLLMTAAGITRAPADRGGAPSPPASVG